MRCTSPKRLQIREFLPCGLYHRLFRALPLSSPHRHRAECRSSRDSCLQAQVCSAAGAAYRHSERSPSVPQASRRAYRLRCRGRFRIYQPVLRTASPLNAARIPAKDRSPCRTSLPSATRHSRGSKAPKLCPSSSPLSCRAAPKYPQLCCRFR